MILLDGHKIPVKSSTQRFVHTGESETLPVQLEYYC